MPDNMIKNLIILILKNKGKLSTRKKKQMFEKLTTNEVEYIERIVKDIFNY